MSKNDYHQASSTKNLQEARRSVPFGSSRLRNHHPPWQTTWPQNKITEPQNITHTGTHAASVLMSRPCRPTSNPQSISTAALSQILDLASHHAPTIQNSPSCSLLPKPVPPPPKLKSVPTPKTSSQSRIVNAQDAVTQLVALHQEGATRIQYRAKERTMERQLGHSRRNSGRLGMRGSFIESFSKPHGAGGGPTGNRHL